MHDADPLDAAWEVVVRWPGLSAAAKLAWWTIWKWARRRPDTVVVHFGALAAEQGTSDKAGREAVKNLESVGLVVDVDRGVRGRATLYVCEPREVCRARGHADGIYGRPIIARHPDPRDSADSDGADRRNRGETSAVPPVAPLPLRAQAHPPSPSPVLLTEESKGAALRAAESPRIRRKLDEAAPIGAAFAASLAERHSPEAFDRRVNELTAKICDAVPSLFEGPARVAAEAVLSHRLPRHELDACFVWVRATSAKQPDVPLWRLFNGFMGHAFARHGPRADWPFGGREKVAR